MHRSMHLHRECILVIFMLELILFCHRESRCTILITSSAHLTLFHSVEESLFYFNYARAPVYFFSSSCLGGLVYNDRGIQVNMLTRFNNSGSCCSTRMAASAHCSSWQVLIMPCPKGTGAERFLITELWTRARLQIETQLKSKLE